MLFTGPSLYYDYDPCLHEVSSGVFSTWVGSIGSGIPFGQLVRLLMYKSRGIHRSCNYGLVLWHEECMYKYNTIAIIRMLPTLAEITRNTKSSTATL